VGDTWGLGGATALSLFATPAAESLARLTAAWPQSLSPDRMAMLRTVTAEGIGLPPLPAPELPDDPEERDLDVLEVAEQVAVDVTRIDQPMRDGWSRTFRDAVVDATVVVLVAEWVPRLRSALDALFGADGWPDDELVTTSRTYALLDDFTRAVARMDRLDAVTTELVRLRGARQHGCRVCMARRSVAALESGAGAELFDDLDDYRRRDLDPAQQAALALTDAMIWTPADLREVDLDAVRTHLTPAVAVEVALDVARNASNKVAVGLGVDAPQTDGLQLFEVDAEGRLVFP
jgi:alkylhydroperoxidase family enzyme